MRHSCSADVLCRRAGVAQRRLDSEHLLHPGVRAERIPAGLFAYQGSLGEHDQENGESVVEEADSRQRRSAGAGVDATDSIYDAERRRK